MSSLRDRMREASLLTITNYSDVGKDCVTNHIPASRGFHLVMSGDMLSHFVDQSKSCVHDSL